MLYVGRFFCEMVYLWNNFLICVLVLFGLFVVWYIGVVVGLSCCLGMINFVIMTIKERLELLIDPLVMSGGFIMSDAPVFVREFYAWQVVSCGFSIVVFIGLSVLAFWIAYKYRGMDDESEMAAVTFGLIFGLSFLVMTSVRLHDFIFMVFAPNVYILDYVGGM